MSEVNSSSVCNIFKYNTSKIIKNMEMKIPVHFQIYSDMYKEYLHMIDDIFGTCIMSEKEFFDKMNINKKLIKNIESNTNHLTDVWISQIENYDNYLKWYYKMRIANMRSYDQFVHNMMDSYAVVLSSITSNLEK